MKVICDRGALVESLNLVGGVVVARTPKPVLACVKLTATEDLLTLAGTDLEVAVRLSTPRVEVQEVGEALVPADKLQQIVRESTDPTLTIETDQDVARITGQDSKFKIFGHPPADFPPIPEFKGDPDFEISAADLHRLIAMTIFATARENSRYAINGVLLERDGKKLAMVATDGHRLALARGTCKTSDEAGRSAIVPTKALNLLLRLFDDAEQTVKIKIADNQILFQTDEALLASNLVEGNFPPYNDVIPKEGDKKATLDTDVFVSAVRRAALLTNEESKGVRMAFSDDGLTLSSRAPEMGEAEVSVPVPQYQGDAIEIGFNPGYLLDALKVIDTGQVQFEFKAPNKPGVLRTGPNFLYVVMPVNLQ
ncbi:DNA polymerase III subunit beta [Phycisphaerales bacterium AB-hyl4]|uniref:Beta sliding clamp n=1 Tax=Natronomicrosphaera hydrolytica TaxID=3242702 RepID=A0ABV4U3L1_9BACT